MGETSEEEVTNVKNLLSGDPAYQRRFEHLKAIWEASRNISLQSTVDENAAWHRFKNRVTYRELQVPDQPENRFGWMKVAASIVTLLGIGLIIYFITNNQKLTQEMAVQSFERVLTDTLPDASVVTLNKKSTLTYPKKFVGNTRSVALKGEAFFTVTANKEKPFIVAVNDLQVRVVGTSFNIKETNGNTVVTVETGIVQVTSHDKTVELRAGEKVDVSPENVELKKESVTDKLYNYYRTKEFVCEETPLWKLVAILNEAYGANITIANSSIRGLPITTTFYNESLDQVLLIISETLNITVIKKENSIVLQ